MENFRFTRKEFVVSAGNAATATQKTEDDIKTRETEKDFALLARSAASVRVDASITVEDAVDVIGDFREMSELGSPVTLKLADSFDLLPEDVRQAAKDAGGTQDNTYAVLHKGGSIPKSSAD